MIGAGAAGSGGRRGDGGASRPGLRPGPVGIALLLGQAVHLGLAHANGAVRLDLRRETLLLVGCSFVGPLAGWLTLDTLLARRRVVRVLATLGWYSAFALTSAWLHATKSSLDYTAMAENVREVFSREAVAVVLAPLGRPLPSGWLIGAGVVLIGLVRLEFPGRRLSRIQRPRARLAVPALLAVWALVTLLPAEPADELAHLLRDAARYHLHALAPPPPCTPLPEALPSRDPGPVGSRWRPRRAPLPQVIVVMLESFGGRFVERRTPEGAAYTPVFNKLIHRGLFVERFYSASVQTSKGTFATLFSLPPLARGKVFADYPDLVARSLPEFLRDAGYRTIYHQGYRKLSFDNTGPMLRAHGFEVVGTSTPWLTAADRRASWGWGPEDAAVYRAALRQLDREHARALQRARGGVPPPFFALIATIQNHMRFRVPAAERALYPHPDSVRQRYANSLHLSDAHLEVLFRALRARPWMRNTVVVLLGDHGFPTGDHGIEHNEIGYYEESFRVPLLILWPGHLRPRRVSGSAWSQLDVAPTLLHLLGLPAGRVGFVGRSILAGPGPAGDGTVWLVQPYNGTFLGAIRWPHKYLVRKRTGAELLFDLAADPDELHDLAAAPGSERPLRELRAEVRRLEKVQRAIGCRPPRGGSASTLSAPARSGFPDAGP